MAEEKEGGTSVYFKALGFIVLGVGLGYLINKWNQNNIDSESQSKAQAELDKITNKVISRVVDTTVATNEKPSVVTDKVSTGEFRNDGFTGNTQNVAAPIEIKVEQKAEPKVEPKLNDAGIRYPSNMIKAQGNNIDAFANGDVIYSLLDSDSKIARLVSGNFTFEDKSGNSMGVMQAKPRQKLGVINKVEMNGVFYKAAPDYKKYAFIGYEKIYKLV